MRIDSSKSFSRGRQRKNDENIEQYRNHQQREMRNELEQQQTKKATAATTKSDTEMSLCIWNYVFWHTEQKIQLGKDEAIVV